MKKVTTREFSLYTSKYLKELPIMITKNGKDHGVLQWGSNVKERSYVATEKKAKSVATPKNVATSEVKEEKVRTSELAGKVCQWDRAYKCKQPATIKVRKGYFCLQHYDDS